MTIAPHGGTLIIRRAVLTETPNKVRLTMDAHAQADLYQIGTGAYSPLTGFLEEPDYVSVRDTMRLADGTPWSLPVTLAVSMEEAREIRLDDTVILQGPDGRAQGRLVVTSKFVPDRHIEALRVFGTDDYRHPGVARLQARNPVYLGGPITLFPTDLPETYRPYWLTPEETRQRISAHGWNTVAGFQTRNPIHRAHEYIQKCALEVVDGLLLHPLVGPTKADDIPPAVRLDSYRALLDHYYPPNRVVFALFGGPMHYAGPREAIFHAIVRQNFGCTHFIVGRDHAGVGHYYGPYDAQRIFGEFAPGELAISPLFFEHAFYCRRCDSMATTKTCPHSPEHHLHLSGTAVRKMLQAHQPLPPQFSRPEVVRVLQAHYTGPQMIDRSATGSE